MARQLAFIMLKTFTMPDITYSCRPATPEETASTVQRLLAHTEGSLGFRVPHEHFAIVAYEQNQLVGAIIGKIFLNWLHLDLVWVDAPWRGKGIGRHLMEQSITEAGKRKLTGIEVWSQSWQAPDFYLRMGFFEFAVMDDFIPGRKRHAFRYLLEGSPV